MYPIPTCAELPEHNCCVSGEWLCRPICDRAEGRTPMKVLAYFKTLSQKMPRGTDISHGNPRKSGCHGQNSNPEPPAREA